jgi:hypothetical protein
MGDISRHRDIFLNTREVIPASLLAKCKLGVADLTYLEMGNYLTDVSQFRDPVFYIFSKQRIWREFVIPEAGDKVKLLRGLSALAALAGVGSTVASQKVSMPDWLSEVSKYGRAVVALAGGVLAVLPTDTYAGLVGADDWIDRMFGTPIERTEGDLKKRDEKHYGYVGQFFRYFTEGITAAFRRRHQKQGKRGMGKDRPDTGKERDCRVCRILHAVLPTRAHRPAAVRLGRK